MKKNVVHKVVDHKVVDHKVVNLIEKSHGESREDME